MTYCCRYAERLAVAACCVALTSSDHALSSRASSQETHVCGVCSFYREATEAVSRAIQAGERRVQVQCTIPELNSQVVA